MLLEPGEQQSRAGGVGGVRPCRAIDSFNEDWLSVEFTTIDGVLSKGATWFAFSSSDLSAFSCILLWGGPQSGGT